MDGLLNELAKRLAVGLSTEGNDLKRDLKAHDDLI